METLTIHTEDAEKMQTVKAVLNALDVQFEPEVKPLPPHVLESVRVSIEQFERGQTISLEEFKAKHLFKR